MKRDGTISKQQNITFTKTDALFYTWKLKAQAAGQNPATLIMYALNQYVEEESFADIGSIYVDEKEIAENPKSSISVRLSFSSHQNVASWINMNIAAGLGIIAPIKYILKNCITEVDSPEKESIPQIKKGTVRKNIDEILLSNARKARESRLEIPAVSEVSEGPRGKEVPDKQPEKKQEETTVTPKITVTQPVTSTKKSKIDDMAMNMYGF